MKTRFAINQNHPARIASPRGLETELVGCAVTLLTLPPRQPGIDPRSGHVGFVVDKVALGQDFSEYFGFPCQSSFHLLLHNHHLSSGAGTIGQQWPTYQVDSVSPHPEKLKKKTSNLYSEGVNGSNHLPGHLTSGFRGFLMFL
jgi:hypothetical protein